MANLLPFIYKIAIKDAINNKLNGTTLEDQLIDWAWGELENKAESLGKLTEYQDIQEREGHEDIVVLVRWNALQFIIAIEEGEY